MMNVTYGRSSGMPFAQYDPDSHYWKTCADISLWDLMLSSLTLPSWGYLRDGVLYELPTPELPTIEHGSLSWLATPTAWLGRREAHSIGDPDRWKDPNRSNELSDQIAAMLPTPTVQASKHLTMDDWGPGTLDDHNLWSVIGRLLPTPVVNDMGSGKSPEWWEDWTEKIGGHGKSLEQEALSIGGNTKQRSADGNPSLTDPPPAPTVRRNDRDRLNPLFVEWMMGLPEGWVTGHGLSAAQELKMLGNGVVPQQAQLALKVLSGAI